MTSAAVYVDELATTVRDVGAQAALEFDDDWRDAAEQAIERLAATGRPFGADDIRWTAGDPSSPNALGAVILAGAKRGRIEFAGWTSSRRVSAHGRAIRLWRGVDREEATA